MNIYKIDPERLSSFMFKKALNDAGLLAGIILFFLLILGISTEMSVIFILLKKGGVGIFFFLLAMFLFSFIFSSIPSSTRFVIGDNHFGRYLDKGEVNAFAQYSLNRLERKSGQKQSEKIYFNETKSIKITKNKIVIKGDHYSFMNGNGRIVIPVEVAEFPEIEKKIIDICRSNRNIKKQFV